MKGFTFSRPRLTPASCLSTTTTGCSLRLVVQPPALYLSCATPRVATSHVMSVGRELALVETTLPSPGSAGEAFNRFGASLLRPRLGPHWTWRSNRGRKRSSSTAEARMRNHWVDQNMPSYQLSTCSALEVRIPIRPIAYPSPLT